MDGFDGLAERAAELERQLGGAGAVAEAFNQELAAMRESLIFTGREVNSLSTSFGHGLRKAFDGVVFDGLRLSDALRQVVQSMADSVYNVAMKPVQQAAGGALANGLNGLLGGVFPFAQGGAFTQDRVMPFAKGGVVTSPTVFPMRGATGLMGEAGPEAIMPLTRGADGRLGVAAQGGGRAVHVVMNISTPDIAGFQRSSSQVAAQVSRALARGERNR
ncbi:phage tail tape measure protein [Thioclava atlantica]|nr:phage tail tape measure protein [Thioclava atlantica]